MKKIKYLVILPLLLTGCYDYHELNDLGIITSFSIDYDEEYKIEIELIDPQKDDSSFLYYEEEAPSIEEALKKITLTTPKKLYGAHLQILILSKEVVQDHLDEILDFFMRDPEFRSEFKILLLENKTHDNNILKKISSSDVLESLKEEEKNIGIIKAYTLNDIASMYLNPNIEITMPSLVIDDAPHLGDAAIFKDKYFLGYLKEDEAKTVNIIKGDTINTIINIPYKDSNIIFEPNKLHIKKDIDIKNNTLNVEIKGYARISEVSSSVNIEDKKEIEKLNKLLNDYLEKMIKDNFIKIRDNYNSDIFGIKDLYYKKKPSVVENVSWYDDIYPNISINVKSKLKLYEKGNTKGVITYERKNRYK